MAIGSHQSSRPGKVVWLTPPGIIDALGGERSFDLDPCSLDPRPWPTAKHHIAPPQDGLAEKWFGRVWLNPPYTATEVGKWLKKLAEHGRGTALIFARTETKSFRDYVWRKATAILFAYGRINFHHGSGELAEGNSGAPPCFIAYGQDDADRLRLSNIKGMYVPLNECHELTGKTLSRIHRKTLYE